MLVKMIGIAFVRKYIQRTKREEMEFRFVSAQSKYFRQLNQREKNITVPTKTRVCVYICQRTDYFSSFIHKIFLCKRHYESNIILTNLSPLHYAISFG